MYLSGKIVFWYTAVYTFIEDVIDKAIEKLLHLYIGECKVYKG